MKLSYKINLVLISILVVMTVAVMIAGSLIIGTLAFKMQDSVLYSELRKSRQVILETLNQSGLRAAARITKKLQTELQQPPLDLKSAQVSVFEFPDRVVFHQDYELDEKIQWPELPELFAQGDGKIEYSDNGADYYGVYTTLQPINWLIVHSIKKDEIYAQKKAYLSSIVVILGVIFLLGALLVHLIVGRFVSRIYKVLDTIRQIEKGNLDVSPKPVSAGDEIGNLQEGINTMSARIKQRTLEREQAERSLRRYEHIISSTNDLMSFVDLNYTYLAVNDAYLKAHDKTLDAIVGHTVQDLIGYDQFHKLAKDQLDLAFSGETVQFQEWFDYKGIGRRFMDVTYYPFRNDHENEISGVVVAVHDLTHRKQAEQEIKKREEKLRFILSSLPDHILEVDSSFRILWANKAVLAQSPHAIGQTCHSVSHRTHAVCEGCQCGKVFETGEIARSLSHAPATDTKKEGYYEIIWVPLKDQDNQVSSVLAVSRNVTEQELSRQRELKLQKDLAQAHKMEAIGTLAGGIAHDFNNMLAIILGFTELSLEKVADDTELESELQEVYAAGKRARDLVSQILLYARKSEEELIPVQIKTIVKEVLKFIRSTIPSAIEIRQDIQSDSLVMGNATQIHQILMNLFTNASQEMEANGGILTVKLEDMTITADINDDNVQLPKGDYIRLEVSDTGGGIESRNLDKIFEPYFTTKDPGEGTGMGLAMVHGIVESYHGRIAVTSNPGQGTTFIIFLPVLQTQVEEKSAYISRDLPSGSESILFVDDEPSITRAGKLILEGLGYSVKACTSSIEALELFTTSHEEFDLVISDITMPKMTGDVLATEILRARPDMPIILTTGYSKKMYGDAFEDIEIKAFINKPIMRTELAETVRRVLDASRGT